VHAVNFEGRFYQTRGPLNSGPCPQGQPVIAQAGGSPRGRQFAAQYADTIVAHTKGVAGMKAYRDDVRARMAAHGRDPDSCKVLFLRKAFAPHLRDNLLELICRPRRMRRLAVRHGCRCGTIRRPVESHQWTIGEPVAPEQVAIVYSGDATATMAR
jgi:alkanesulfonate monooxygenase SsuD/methylene tetrahydromethanopterin reductase-like flavin-dependent oxidoreductase (luciferase family)